MLQDERASVPEVAKPKKGTEDEFHIVQESPLKQKEGNLWMGRAHCIPENFDIEFSTPRHSLVRMLSAEHLAGSVGRALLLLISGS